MSREIPRRAFITTGARAGLALALGKGLISELADGPVEALAAGKTRLAAASGTDYEKAARKAVELLGGMRKFVPKNAKVALLPNVQSRHPGTFTGPGVVRAVIRMCREAGAGQVDCLSIQAPKQWEDTGLKAVLDAEGAGLKLFEKKEEMFRPVPVPGAAALPEARVLAAFFDYDVLINMPVTKDHAGNKFTGTMKNLMGLNSPLNNRSFHRPNWKTDPNDIAHLDQSIVDLNKAIKPTLHVVDATEFIVTNGPFGPGELLKPQKVVAGTDRVAIDAYCAALWGLKPEDILMIRLGAEQGLGSKDPSLAGLKEAGA